MSRCPVPFLHLDFSTLVLRPASYRLTILAYISVLTSSYLIKKTANRFPHQKDRVDSDTAESSEDEDDDDEENDRTRVYQNGRNRSSDVDATRVEHSAYQDQDPSFEIDQGGKVTSSRRGKASERNLFSNGSTYDVRGVEVFKVPSRPMARRQGKPVKESRMAEPQESNGTVEEVDEDDDELPPPLTSSAKTSSNREKSNGLLRTRAATIQTTVTTRRSGRISNASTHDVAPRRSGRSSTDASVPKLKVGESWFQFYSPFNPTANRVESISVANRSLISFVVGFAKGIFILSSLIKTFWIQQSHSSNKENT